MPECALAGIGFTVSIFVASLAFPDARSLEEAKLRVLLASALATAAGALILGGARLGRRPTGSGAGP